MTLTRLIKGFLMAASTLGLFFALALTVFTIKFGPFSSPATMVNLLLSSGIDAPSRSTVAERLKVPEGFSIGQYATAITNARFTEFTRSGDLIVSQPRQGKVTLLRRDGYTNGKRDAQHDGEVVLMDKLNRPQGLAFYQDYLYIAESDAVGRVQFDHGSGTLRGSYERLISLPDSGGHGTKSIIIRDDTLYLSIGSSCNVCEEEDKRRATIMRFDVDGSNGKIFASGLRNSVGLDFAPWNGDFYATDNGRDMLGDDYPPCELNRIEENGFYGWPYINGGGDLDPDLDSGKENLLASAISPVFNFRAHNAPLGIRFLRRAHMPAGYEKTALVALHGSWNRSKPDGYKVVSLHWQEDDTISSRDFFTGFELAGDIIGRPVAIAEGPDGCVYVSDDYAGTIYRVCYGEQQNTLAAIVAAPLADPYYESLADTARRQSAQRGRTLYRQHQCSSCHLVKGAGNSSGKVLAALNQRYTSASLAGYFLSPNPPMPPLPLSEQERLDLAGYLLFETR